MNSINPPQTCMQLYDTEGRRLYFTKDERRAFVAAAAKAPA
jgi:integrase/recombinase XerD